MTLVLNLATVLFPCLGFFAGFYTYAYIDMISSPFLSLPICAPSVNILNVYVLFLDGHISRRVSLFSPTVFPLSRFFFTYYPLSLLSFDESEACTWCRFLTLDFKALFGLYLYSILMIQTTVPSHFGLRICFGILCH